MKKGSRTSSFGGRAEILELAKPALMVWKRAKALLLQAGVHGATDACSEMPPPLMRWASRGGGFFYAAKRHGFNKKEIVSAVFKHFPRFPFFSLRLGFYIRLRFPQLPPLSLWPPLFFLRPALAMGAFVVIIQDGFLILLVKTWTG